MLQSVSGVGIDAPRVDRDTPIHQLSLCFERERLRVTRQDPPWKVVRAFGSLVHLNNVSGGVLAGDRLALDVEVQAGAAAQITTTGATRLYRHRTGASDSEQHARFWVADGALLEYLPDAVIPYAGTRHVQRTEIRLSVSRSSDCAFRPKFMPESVLSLGKTISWNPARKTYPRRRGCSNTHMPPACAQSRKGFHPHFGEYLRTG
jgi:hypothetical protein